MDGQSADGRALTIDDLGPVVRQFDPTLLPSALLARPAQTSLYSFGARDLWLPRDQVLDYLGNSIQIRVFEHETWIDGATLPYATVAHECADFIQSDLAPIVEEMDFDPSSGQAGLFPRRGLLVDLDEPVLEHWTACGKR